MQYWFQIGTLDKNIFPEHIFPRKWLKFCDVCSTLSKGLTTDDINPCPNKAMQLDPCVKASRDPRYRSNRPNSQRCRPATDAGWKQRPRWCSTTQTRTTRSRLRRAGAATTITTTTRRMRTPGNTRRPMALNLANFVNEIKHQSKSLFFKGSQKWLPLTNPLAPQQWVARIHESLRSINVLWHRMNNLLSTVFPTA